MGVPQAPVYFSHSCTFNWTTPFDRNITVKESIKKGTAFYIPAAAETQVDCGTGRQGSCQLNLQGQIDPSYISPDPNLSAHLFVMTDIGGMVTGINYDFDCSWAGV